MKDYNPRVPFSKNPRPPPRAAPSPFMPVSVALQTASMGVHATRNPKIVGPSFGAQTGPLASHVPVKPLLEPTHVRSQSSRRQPSELHASQLLPPMDVDQTNPLSTPLISPPKITMPTAASKKPSTPTSRMPSLLSL